MLESSFTVKKLITPEEYLQIPESELMKYKSIKVIPPKLGDDHFGMIELTYIDFLAGWKISL